jgi:hypothetical protein
MAKLAAISTASLSQYPPSGDYVFQVNKFEYSVKDTGSGNFDVALEIVESADKTELVGRKVFMNINVLKKDGTQNDTGAADVRKIVAAVHGLDASADPEYDTDNLLNERFFAKLSVTEKDGQENVRLSKHASV